MLSYNFNLLPNCISVSNAHYAEERIQEFVSRVGTRFDILALQEVFASALIPVAAREYLCNQHQLIHLLSEPQPKSVTDMSKDRVDSESAPFASASDILRTEGEASQRDLPVSSAAHHSATSTPALFPFVVKARQPSFLRMSKHSIITDSGLLILSKFPIVDSGSMYFKSTHGRQLAPKGCLFAKIRLSDELFVIVVNVHLSSSSSAQETSADGPASQTISDQLKEMRHFIETIQLEHPNCPMLIAGDFNINGIAQQIFPKRDPSGISGRSAVATPPIGDPLVSQPAGLVSTPSAETPTGDRLTPINMPDEEGGASVVPGVIETAAYRQLVATMRGISNDTCEVLRDSTQHHPPTRPATLQFPSFLNKMVATRFPQRHDYCFFTNGNAEGASRFTLGHPRLQRFIASSQRPYMYLSDHFGISVTLRSRHIDFASAMRAEGGTAGFQSSRSWFYPLLKHARSVSRKDFSNGWERYFESAFFDSTFKVLGYLMFPLLIYYLLVGLPLLWYVAIAIVIGLAANHVFGNRVMTELRESSFGGVDKDVIAGRSAVLATSASVGAASLNLTSLPKSYWEMWARSVNDYGWQPCVGYRVSELHVRWLTYLEVDKQARALGSALKGLRAKPGSVVGILTDCHHMNPIIDLACQGYGFVCLPLVPDVKISRGLMDSHGCKICICTRKYTPRLLLARSRQLTCVVQLEEIGSYEYDLARGASIDLRGYEQIIRERQSHGALDRPICEEQSAAEAAASFAAAANSVSMGATGTAPMKRRSLSQGRSVSPTPGSFSAEVAYFSVGDEEEVTRTVVPFSRQQLVNSIISVMTTNLVQDRSAMPNLTDRKDPSSAKIFGIVAPFLNSFNRQLMLAVLASGHQLAMCEQGTGNAAVDLRAMKPDVFVCTRAYLMHLSARLGIIESRYCWCRQLLFRWAYRFRSRLLRHSNRDSTSLRSLFFSSTFGQKIMRARGVTIRRLIVESPSISIPYRVKEMAMLCITPVVRECVVDAFGSIVAVDGTPPPNTMIALERLAKDTEERGDGMVGGVTLKRIGAGARPPMPCAATSPVDGSSAQFLMSDTSLDRNGDEWCDTKLVAMWQQDRKLHFLGARADMLWPLGNVRAVATELEALYKRSCPMIHHIFITCDDQRPLLAIIVPHRDVVEDILEQRIGNWSVFTQAATPLLMESLNRIAAANNLPPAHFIEFIHIHPHAFNLHDDFVSASGGLRRRKIRDYFRVSISRLYSGRVANGGGGLTSAAGNEDDIPATPVGVNTAHSFAAIGQQPSYTARRDGYSGPQASTPFAVDIGGTCAKFAFFQPPNAPSLPKFCQLAKVEASFALPKNLKFFRNQSAAEKDCHAGELRFVQCSTQDVPAMVQYIADNKLCDKYKEEGLQYIPATGGGAFRFAPLVESQLGIQLTQLKEMDCIISGINFLLRHAPELTFTFDVATSRRVPCPDPTLQKRRSVALSGDIRSPFEASAHSTPTSTPAPDNRGIDSSSDLLSPVEVDEGTRQRQKDAFTASFFPYLLVNIGSGVSMIRCSSEREGDFVRVGGSLIGGGTFWGLVRSMTNLTSWDEINEMTRVDGPGDNTNVDLLVGDIYGYNATSLPGNLHVDIVASTFGKMGAGRGEQYFQDGMTGGPTAQDEESLLGDDISPSHASVHHSRQASVMGAVDLDIMARSISTADLKAGPGQVGSSTDAGSSPATGPSGRASRGHSHAAGRPQPIDIVRSLVIMMAFNVSQLANLTCQIEGIKTVFFTGGFVRNNPIVHNQLTKALQYWSGGKLQARFLEPDGFVGTLGSLQHVPAPNAGNGE